MTSLLAFAWRRQANNSKTSTVDKNDRPDSPQPPAVTASASSETTQTLDEYSTVLVQFKDNDHNYDDANRLLATPVTPDGLRPRPTTTDLRHELHLHLQQQQQPQQVPWLSRDMPSTGLTVLPPRTSSLMLQPSTSWSLQGFLSSPPVSTNSFYMRDEEDVASSPHLLPGHARTAVGALVAQQQQWLGGGYDRSVHSRSESSGVLPPKQYEDWYQQDDEQDDEHGGFEVPYYALDAVEHSRTPPRPARSRTNHSQSPFSNHSSPAASPSSRIHNHSSRPLSNSFNHSNRMQHQQQQQQDLVNTSYSSATGLMRVEIRNLSNRYDFGPIVVPDGDRVAGTEVVLPPTTDTLNLSAMSHSIHEDSLYNGNNSRTVSHDEDDLVQQQQQQNSGYHHLVEPPEENDHGPYALDGALQNQKVRNQRRVKEELMVAAMERLQDDMQLIQDVQQVFGCDNHNMEEAYLQQQDGLLNGFSQETRTVIVRNLSLILHEMDSVPAEEYFLSPSQVPVYADTHDDLREALVFCRAVVRMAVPASEKKQGFVGHQQQGRWQFLEGLRAALGIIPPESPEIIRGGDTSVFSLPCDSAETPMTSNVSLTTTITSAVTSPLNDRVRKLRLNGLQLRRTIDILSTVLGKMSDACLGLSQRNSETSSWNLGAEASIRLTEDIKRNYLQLLAVKPEDLRSVVDAFEFYLPPLAITREVSGCLEDQDDFQQQKRGSVPAILPPPPVLLRLAPAANRVLQQNTDVVAVAPCNRRMSRTPRTSGGIFSPGTDDMRTMNSHREDANQYDEFDDLRRTVGSNDYGNEAELRDACPEEQREGAFPTTLANCCSVDDDDNDYYARSKKRE
jgi:hypothetical protein